MIVVPAITVIVGIFILGWYFGTVSARQKTSEWSDILVRSARQSAQVDVAAARMTAERRLVIIEGLVKHIYGNDSLMGSGQSFIDRALQEISDSDAGN